MSNLLQAAERARERAYAPYSGFLVGCAIRGEDGEIYVGCNVENAAYPQGHCAERSAVSALVVAGGGRIAEVAIAGGGDEPCAPCGGCRQLLSELADPGILVHMTGRAGTVTSATLGELLPLGFGPRDLGAAECDGAECDGAECDGAECDGAEYDGKVPPTPYQRAMSAAARLRPSVALVLGSGLDAVRELVEPVETFDLGEIVTLPGQAVAGHARRLVLGRVNGVGVACLEGRAHLYENDASAPLRIVRLFRDMGCDKLLLTSAVGGIRRDLEVGAIVRITDHLNLTGIDPLTGPNDEQYGPRFVDLSRAYDRELGGLLDEAACEAGIPLSIGVYGGWHGPCFETPAEIGMFRTLGADVVGMSIVAEVISAAHAGLRTAAISVVANRAAGLTAGPIDHAGTLQQGRSTSERVAALVSAFIGKLA